MLKKIAFFIVGFCSFTSFVFGDSPVRSHSYSDSNNSASSKPNKDATLSARTCIDHSGVYFTGDFIYWRARGEELFFAGRISDGVIDAVGNQSLTVKDQEVHFEYDPGFKAGVGGNLPFDGWDLYLNWTHLHNNPSTTISSSTPDLTPLFGDSTVTGGLPIGDRAKGSWNVLFNSIDFDWGRLLYLSKTLYIRPSFGAKAAWVHQEINFKMTGLETQQVIPLSLPEMFLKAHNKYWGVGPYFAMNGVWNWGWGFGIYGQISGALLWGKFRQDLKLGSLLSDTQTLTVKSESETYRVRPTIQAFVGLDWRSCVYNDWIALNFRAGWEVQYFWSQFLNPFGGIEESDFTLEGVTVTGRIDF